jgi:hypothetical protein
MAALVGEQTGDGKGARRPRTLPEDEEKVSIVVNVFKWQAEDLSDITNGQAVLGVVKRGNISELIRSLLSHKRIDPLYEEFAGEAAKAARIARRLLSHDYAAKGR